MGLVIELIAMLMVGLCIGLILAPRVEITETRYQPIFRCQHKDCGKEMILVPIFKKGKHTGFSRYFCPDGHTGTPNCK